MKAAVAANTTNTETRTFMRADKGAPLCAELAFFVVASYQMNQAAAGMQNSMPSQGRLFARVATANPSTTPFHAAGRLKMRPRAPNTSAPPMAAAAPPQKLLIQ